MNVRCGMLITLGYDNKLSVGIRRGATLFVGIAAQHEDGLALAEHLLLLKCTLWPLG
jgi:hypothetical protein